MCKPRAALGGGAPPGGGAPRPWPRSAERAVVRARAGRDPQIGLSHTLTVAQIRDLRTRRRRRSGLVAPCNRPIVRARARRDPQIGLSHTLTVAQIRDLRTRRLL